MAPALQSKRPQRAADAAAREAAARIVRVLLTILGALIMVAGVLIAPLPGPMGLPVVVIGLMIILRNSFKARRQFVKFQRAHPKVASPIRRLLRRDPAFLAFTWHQALRVERLVLRSRPSILVKVRRKVFRRKVRPEPSPQT